MQLLNRNVQVLYEDEAVLAVRKPCGIGVQHDRSGDISLMDYAADYLRSKKRGNAYIGLVHRIDKPASGVVIFGKTPEATARLNAGFGQAAFEKTYWAVLDGSPEEEEGILTHYCKKDGKNNKSYAFDSPGKGRKKAVLRFRRVGLSDRYTFLEILLVTGRHHQIRCQLARINCHIKGDVKYGFPRTIPGGGIALHAYALGFPHPVTGEWLYIHAEPPSATLWDLFKQVYHAKKDKQPW